MATHESFTRNRDGREVAVELADYKARSAGRRGTISIREPLRQASALHQGKATSQPRPRDRFRLAVHKVIAIQRTSTVLGRGGIGAEPGVDPKKPASTALFDTIKNKCSIEVIDYSSVRFHTTSMDNEQLQRFLAGGAPRDPWVKVRWINVGGLSWDVIQALAIKYDIHPLAIENILQSRQRQRSKADYYPKHLFLRILCHTLQENEPQDESSSFSRGTASTEIPPVDDPSPRELHTGTDGLQSNGINEARDSFTTSGPSTFFRKIVGPVLMWGSKQRHLDDSPLISQKGLARTFSFNSQVKTRKDMRNLKIIQQLLKGQRVNVRVTPMNILLFRDGTVISVQQETSLIRTNPIAERLQHATSGLRTSPDASLLAQSLIDLVVDQALEVVQEYQSKILKLEQAVLIDPQMKHVVRLHALHGDLILHRRTLEPIKALVFALRRYDVDRTVAMEESYDSSVNIDGFMSHKAKIYLADVHDHIVYALANLETFSGVCDNLIDYTFSMSSHEMSEIMRRLTLATVIFLPLTVLAGYFGMNFEAMWTTYHGHSDIIYWIIALPMLLILIPIFLWSDLQRMRNDMRKYQTAKELKQRYR